ENQREDDAMQTVYYAARGAAREVLRFEDGPPPEPGAGEVQVRVHASGINPSDVKTRAGANGRMTAPRTVPHSDGAGVITAIGAGVPDRRIGERVWLFNVNRTADGLGQGERGTAAEAIVVDQRLAVPLPANASFEIGACLGVPAMTAHRAVMADGSVAGKSVLVTGGAGAVGSMAIQIARWSGAANVIATVSTPLKAETALADGAHATVNYKSEPLAERILAVNGGKRVDRIVDVDFAAHAEVAVKVLAPGGVIATYASMSNRTPALPFYPLMFNDATIRLVAVYVMGWPAKEAAASDINQMLEAGKLRPRIAARYPLRSIVEAHETAERGDLVGKVVVAID
ncbi:MAG TPA: NADPH:quinone reductase, partial [Hyphomicrobiaceae bacterium]|nr:NADPH:quinone reductase [Hyphomicrobiaceae bacterium]